MSLEDKLRQIIEDQGTGGETGNSWTQNTQTTRVDPPGHHHDGFAMDEMAARKVAERQAAQVGPNARVETLYRDIKNGVITSVLVNHSQIGQRTSVEQMQAAKKGMSSTTTNTENLFRKDVIGVVQTKMDGTQVSVSTSARDIQKAYEQAELRRILDDDSHLIWYPD